VCADGGPTSSCERHPQSAADSDDPDGRDNGALALLDRSELGPLFSFSTSQGRFHLLVEIKEWNGGDDPDVTVGFYLSDGAEPATQAGAGTPLWQGDDVWTTRQDSTFDGVSPRYVATHAYVTGGMVVGSMTELVFTYGLPIVGVNERLTVKLTDVLFSLPFSRVGAIYHVDDGVIAGRWPTGELLKGLAVIPDLLREASPPEKICGPNLTYQNIRTLVCVGADIARFRSSDGKGQPCNALSIVFGLTGVQARIGKRFDLDMPAGGCGGAAWMDDCPPR
jgi:hypothetical protein